MNRENTIAQLRSVLVQLTRHHGEYINDSKVLSSSKDEYVIAEPLLDQLRDAVAPSKSGGGGGGSAGGWRPPLNISAVSLLKELGDYAFTYGHGETIEDALETIVEEHEASGTDQELEAVLREYRSFAGRIRQLLTGPKKRLRMPCLHCGQEWVYNEEGIRELAHTYYEGKVQCLACGTETHILDYKQLLEAVRES